MLKGAGKMFTHLTCLRNSESEEYQNNMIGFHCLRVEDTRMRASLVKKKSRLCKRVRLGRVQHVR